MLGLGSNPALEALVERYGPGLGAGRFLAGTTLTQALAVALALNRQGMGITLDHLGEEAVSPADQQAATAEYLKTLDALLAQRINGGVSIKLSMVGDGARAIVDRASQHGQLVWIDMEHSATTETTLKTYRTLASDYPRAVGAVLQAYLYRSAEDLEDLMAIGQPCVRIVKGAYREPVAVALQDKADVDQNYLALVERAIKGGAFTAVATHDEKLISKVLGFMHRQHVAPAQVEFQMLYGIKLGVLEELVGQGYAGRVYVPYGTDWYRYYLRRLAERPANLLFFLKALTTREPQRT